MSDEPFDPVAWTERQGWTYAKTAPAYPHEYLLPESSDEDFPTMVAHIAEHGWRGEFQGNRYTYLTLDGWDYWRSWRPVALNRRRSQRDASTREPTLLDGPTSDVVPDQPPRLTPESAKRLLEILRRPEGAHLLAGQEREARDQVGDRPGTDGGDR